MTTYKSEEYRFKSDQISTEFKFGDVIVEEDRWGVIRLYHKCPYWAGTSYASQMTTIGGRFRCPRCILKGKETSEDVIPLELQVLLDWQVIKPVIF